MLNNHRHFLTNSIGNLKTEVNEKRLVEIEVKYLFYLYPNYNWYFIRKKKIDSQNTIISNAQRS